jgi:hypothetical protein
MAKAWKILKTTFLILLVVLMAAVIIFGGPRVQEKAAAGAVAGLALGAIGALFGLVPFLFRRAYARYSKLVKWITQDGPRPDGRPHTLAEQPSGPIRRAFVQATHRAPIRAWLSHTRPGRLPRHKFLWISGLVAVLVIMSAGIWTTNAIMPDSAHVIASVTDRTYIAPPCIDIWRQRGATVDKAFMVLKAGTVRKQQYMPDVRCRDTGAFYPTDRSLIGHMFVQVGALEPLQHWWDTPNQRDIADRMVRSLYAGPVVDHTKSAIPPQWLEYERPKR